MRGLAFGVALAVALLLAFGLQSRARLTFPSYDEHAEYHWVGDFGDPSECEESVDYIQARAPNMGARCAYAPRLKVWWLTAQNMALVQAPNVAALF